MPLLVRRAIQRIRGLSESQLEITVKDQSKDIEAADAYATTLFNLNPQDVSPTVAACKRGLDEIVLNNIVIVLRIYP
jgi:hypothetical protein